LRDHGWQDCADLSFDPTGVREVEAEIKFSN
jgi:hypothetical protein